LPPIAELVKLTGDPVKGAAVFRSDAVACNKCHQVNGEGVDFGPNLSEIGTKLGRDALYGSILDPSAGISFGFEAWQITFKNGDDAYGLLASETADELAIKAVGGIVTRYKKSDIAHRAQQKLSIMPAGLQQAMSRQELVDLVEYLSSLLGTKP
jgi:putative heme-binding domain-containing protein